MFYTQLCIGTIITLVRIKKLFENFIFVIQPHHEDRNPNTQKTKKKIIRLNPSKKRPNKIIRINPELGDQQKNYQEEEEKTPIEKKPNNFGNSRNTPIRSKILRRGGVSKKRTKISYHTEDENAPGADCKEPKSDFRDKKDKIPNWKKELEAIAEECWRYIEQLVEFYKKLYIKMLSNYPISVLRFFCVGLEKKWLIPNKELKEYTKDELIELIWNAHFETMLKAFTFTGLGFFLYSNTWSHFFYERYNFKRKDVMQKTFVFIAAKYRYMRPVIWVLNKMPKYTIEMWYSRYMMQMLSRVALNSATRSWYNNMLRWMLTRRR